MQLNIKNKYILFVVLILLVGVLITTLAYFNATVIGIPLDNSELSTGTFELSISDSTVNVSDLAPIYDEDYETQAYHKSFSVTSSSGGTLNVCSSIYLNIISISETLKSQYFKYIIITTDDEGVKSNFLNANTTDDFLTIDGVFFEPGETKTFNLYIWISYAEGVDQTGMLGTSMSATVKAVGKDKRLEDACVPELERMCLPLSNLKCKILSDNTVYPDNISSPHVTSSSGVDFTTKSTHTNGQGLYTNNKLEDGKNKYFRGGSYCAYPNYQNEDLSGTYCTSAGGTWSSSYYTCSLNTDRATCQSLGYTYYDLKNNVTFAGHNWRIIRIDENSNIRMIVADSIYNAIKFNDSSNDNAYVGYMYGDISLFGDTITSTTSNLNMGTNANYYSTSYARNVSNLYYLTGTMVSGVWNTESICTSSSCPVTNYYTCLSTNSSGTCAALYKISSWHNATRAKVYTITLKSTSYELAHTNTNNSTIKTYANSWYNTNLSSYSSYLADAGYCNDRSISSGLGYGTNNTIYGPYARNYPNSTANPRLACPNLTRDLFTTSTSAIGNKALTYPIGLITVDEARYAGMVYNNTYNFTNYLKFNNDYWTMSTFYFSGSAAVCRVYSYGYFDSYSVGNYSAPRASISLKSNTAVSSGTGTYDDPYVIQ